jgi:hypothetical protein
MILRPLLLPLLACAACDGGDSATPPTPSVAITADNALAVAGAAWHAAFDPVQVARIAALFLEIEPPAPPDPPELPGGSAAAIVVQEIEGPEGGVAIFTWDDRDADLTYSSGDRFAIGFAEYGAGGLVLTGSAAFGDVAIDGDLLDGQSWKLDATFVLTGLRLVDGEWTTTLTGEFDCTREKRATVYTLALLPLDRPQLGPRTLTPTTTIARNDYVLDFTMGLFADGALEDPTLGGTVLLTTEAPLTGLQVLRGPSAGLLTVQGTNGSTVSLQAIDFFNLELLVDEDGDGEIDVTIPAEWAALPG